MQILRRQVGDPTPSQNVVASPLLKRSGGTCLYMYMYCVLPALPASTLQQYVVSLSAPVGSGVKAAFYDIDTDTNILAKNIEDVWRPDEVMPSTLAVRLKTAY